LKGLFFLLILTQLTAYAEEAEFISPSETPPCELATEPIGNDLIDIENVKYRRSEKATFCTRPISMIDTIVVHHSETRNTDTPEKINEYHLVRGSATDPWYMVAYSYLFMAPYEGDTTPVSKAFAGRPLCIVGAHAGTNVFVPMSAHQKTLWKNKEIKCGTATSQAYDASLVKNGKIKANVTTIGMVIIGNYAPGSPSNPNGDTFYEHRNGKRTAVGRKPTDDLLDMYARLACQLQKKHPRITKLSYHDKYHATSCPGELQFKEGMQTIQLKAREYGCEFQVVWKERKK
jgi:hypothetical protein